MQIQKLLSNPHEIQGALRLVQGLCAGYIYRVVIPNILVTDNDGLLYPNESKGVKQNPEKIQYQVKTDE